MSERFSIRGEKVGATLINITYSDDTAPRDVDAIVWTVKPIVDYGGLGTARKCHTLTPPLTTVGDISSGNISPIISCGEEIKSAAADGAAKLMLKVEAGAKGKACFEIIDDGNPLRTVDGGTLTTIDDFDPVTISPTADIPTKPDGGKEWAFAAYAVPDEFESSPFGDTRNVKIGIAFNPEQRNSGYRQETTTVIEVDIPIVRPPVFLVHGWRDSEVLWEKSPDASDSFWPWRGRQKVYKFDYSILSQSLAERVSPRLRDFMLEQLKKDYRNKSDAIAAYRADIVTHSYGGVITRTVIADTANYKISDNLFSGTVRKIAAIGTPHEGSLFANLIVYLHDQFGHGNDYGYVTESVEERLEEGTVIRGFHFGAICNLAEGNAYIDFPAEDSVSEHAYVGTAGVLAGPTPPGEKIEEGYDNWSRIPGRPSPPTVSLYYPSEEDPNDGVVIDTSAAGGLTDQAAISTYDLFHNITFASKDLIEQRESLTHSTAVIDQIIEDH